MLDVRKTIVSAGIDAPLSLPQDYFPCVTSIIAIVCANLDFEIH